MATMNDYATNFRNLRLESGHTQESLGFALGMHTSTISKIESGKRKKKDMDIIPKLAKAINKTPEDILNDLHGLTVNSSIEENHGNGVNVQNHDIEVVKSLYERIIAEKERYI